MVVRPAALSLALVLGLSAAGCMREPVARPTTPWAYPPGGYGQPGYPGGVAGAGRGGPGASTTPTARVAPAANPMVGWSGPPAGASPTEPPLASSSAAPPPEPSASPSPNHEPRPLPPPPHGPVPEGFRLPLPAPTLPPHAPAMRYANLSPRACRALVRERNLPVKFEAKAVRRVALAARVTGPMHGVRIVTAPAPSPYGILDCRLALALDDMTEVMARFGVSEIRIGSMHRPGATIRGRGKPSQHSHALALDISVLRRHDGRMVAVEGTWGADIGDRPCGPGAPLDSKVPDALFMRDMVCAVARAQIFHHMLTPSANADHLNHFHFDIKRDARRSMIR
ncbi:MAG: hypothetical protein AAF928_11160 [Myxococcota bacterium]